MQVMPIDLEAIIAIVMGISIVLIPVAGLTARFALKPTVEAMARLFEHKGLEETVDLLERRMGFLETRMESMDSSLRRLADAVEFDAELRAPEARRSLGSDTPSGSTAGTRSRGNLARPEAPTGEEGVGSQGRPARDDPADGTGSPGA